MQLDLCTKINVDLTVANGDIIDTQGCASMAICSVAKNGTKISLRHGNEPDLSDGAIVRGDWILVGDASGVKSDDDADIGTSGYVVDTTTYPVATQATKTEKITADSGTEQTVTFTTAIDIGSIVDTTTYPVADQDTNTLGITLDGGDEQTITFDGATTTAAHVIAQVNDQLVGGHAEPSGDQVRILSDTVSATSAVAVNVTACDLTFAAASKVNQPDGIASQINAQTFGIVASVVGGQTKLTSNSTGTDSAVAIGTGTADLTWDTAVAGTGSAGAVVAYTEAATASIGYIGNKRYIQPNIVSQGTDTTIAVVRGDLEKAPR